jgi:hypothetical protein
MSHVFGNANKTATLFAGVRGEGRFILYIVHWLVKGESKKWAYIRGNASENPKGDLPLKRFTSSVVKNEANI